MMLAGDIQTAVLSFKRHRLLTILAVLGMATGISTCMVTITMYRALSHNPIIWKNDRLYAVAIDSKSDEKKSRQEDTHPNDPPKQLTYRDAKALFASEIPLRKVRMYQGSQILDPLQKNIKPFRVTARLTSADFFPMFDAPFKYGNGWTGRADIAPDPVVVISNRINDKIFSGENSIGRAIQLNGVNYRIIGVLGNWMPQPRFYDLTFGGAVLPPEDIFLPFLWGEVREINSSGSVQCNASKSSSFSTYHELINAECSWIQFWVEFSKNSERLEFSQFMDSYVLEQKKIGRLPRPLNNRLFSVGDWLIFNEVVDKNTVIEIVVSALFLIVCLFNTISLILVRLLSVAPINALRRALGATRVDIFRQHLIEITMISLAGGMLGSLGAVVGLWTIRNFAIQVIAGYDNNPDLIVMLHGLTNFDGAMLLVTLGLSLLAGFLAGLYPALRISMIPPAKYLKVQ